MSFFKNLELGWQDALDIGLLYFILYRALMLIKGTRTIPMLMGFFLLFALYLFSQVFQLDAIGLLLDNVVTSLVLVFVVLFQADLRNALAQFGLMALFRDSTGQNKKDLVDQCIQACMVMARRRIGALIVFEREAGLRNFIEKSTILDAVPSEALLLSIFHPTSPLHDGAVVIDKKGRLAAARCILPVSMNQKINPALGTRHRAAIGLSEENDAVVLIVSEERSEISLSYKGQLMRAVEENVKQILLELLVGKLPDNVEQKTEQEPVLVDQPPPVKESEKTPVIPVDTV
ncbi:MAG: TIGR00159 family protein [SAR324 cluster bacterium]|nr:TIGR00159 family protein [SAR324 cluster bacterium]